jgi:hypothetical protein
MLEYEKGFFMKTINLLTLSFLTLLLMGCNSKDANHLNIFSLPGAVVGTTIGNTTYNRSRVKVERYVQSNYDVLKYEIKRGDGNHIDKLLKLANIKKSKYSLAKKQLSKDYKRIFHNVELTIEPIIQTFSKLYMPKSAKDKTMNGFTYNQAWSLIFKRVDRDFELLRANVKQGQQDVLSKIADDLHIDDKKKREHFLELFDGKYKMIFIDPLVVAVMIHS